MTMTPEQWFAFVILPIVVAGLGWVIVLVNDWHMRRKHPEDSRHG
jgi:heme/copper-type cytochrome/quinol oxidase subunit 4